MTTAMLFMPPELPWHVTAEERAQLQKLWRSVLAITLLLCAIITIWTLPVPERSQLETPPARIARLLPERQAMPPPKPIEKSVAAELPPAKPKPDELHPAAVERARNRASRSGLLALSAELADLRSNADAGSLARGRKLERGTGGGAAVNERAILTARSGSGSGGIQGSALSRDTGGAGSGLGYTGTRMASPAGGGEGGGSGGSYTRGGGKASRSLEDIRIVFDQNKSAIYTLYNRALRDDPGLQGKVVLKLTIAPSGAVTACVIVSSELDVPELERKLVARISQFDFGAKAVGAITVTWPVDFLPS